MARSSSKKVVPVNLSKERIDSLSKLLVGDLRNVVDEGVHDWIRELAVTLAQLLMNAEVLELAGERYRHNAERGFVRWGEQAGSGYLLQQRVPLAKPRSYKKRWQRN